MSTATARGRALATAAQAVLWTAALLSTARTARQAWTGYLAPGVATPADPGTMMDFRDATYYPAKEFLRSGGMPYDPAVMFAHWPVTQEFDLYLPAHLLLHAPLTLLPFGAAAVVQFAVDAALITLLCWWAVRWAVREGMPQRWAPYALPALLAAVASSQVGKAQLVLGQVNPLVAVGAAGALALRDRPRLAALGMALAWIKPQFGLPLFVLLLVRDGVRGGRGREAPYRRTALLGTGLAALASLPVVAVLVARAGGVGGFLDVVRANLAYATGHPATAVSYPLSERVDVLAVLSRSLSWTPSGAVQALAPVLVVGLTAVVVRRATAAGVAPVVVDLLCLLATLAALVHQPGDSLVVLPFAVATVVHAARLSPARRRIARAAALLTLVPFADIYLVSAQVTAIAGRQAARTVDGVAVATAWILLLALLALVARTPDATPQTAPEAEAASPSTTRPGP